MFEDAEEVELVEVKILPRVESKLARRGAAEPSLPAPAKEDKGPT